MAALSCDPGLKAGLPNAVEAVLLRRYAAMPQPKAIPRDAAVALLSEPQLILELIRPWGLFLAYWILARGGHFWLAVPFAVATCLAAFVQAHDTIHASLGLPRAYNELMLSASSLLLLKSGHALRATHLRHHGQCLGERDPEGAPAHWTLSKVLWHGPFHMLALRRDALAIAPRTRGVQLTETAATVVLLGGAVLLYVYGGDATGLVYWAVAATVSALMPLWAAFIPHRLASHNPVIRGAARLAQVWTPVLSSFAYHHVHHRFPKVPTALLPSLARGSDVGSEHDHVHEDPDLD